MNIIGNKYIFLSISGLLILASIFAISFYGFKLGIDFSGGTLWQVKFTEQNVAREQLSDFLISELKVINPIITTENGTGSFLIRISELNQQEHESYLGAIAKKFGAVDELQFETIGSSIGSELRTGAITAFILVLFGISLYIAFAFRKVSRPVNSWKYGIITLLTLFHDAIIPAGLFALLGHIFNAEIDTNFIVAILVVMGFSVHDTIVVFDRIRENLRNANHKSDFGILVNDSVNQTFARSLNTSLTLILVLAVLYFLGSGALRYFVLTMGVGTIVGTYSSIFIASPLLTIWRGKTH